MKRSDQHLWCDTTVPVQVSEPVLFGWPSSAPPRHWPLRVRILLLDTSTEPHARRT